MYTERRRHYDSEENEIEYTESEEDAEDVPPLPAPVVVTANRKIINVKQVERIDGYFHSPENKRRLLKLRKNVLMQRFLDDNENESFLENDDGSI